MFIDPSPLCEGDGPRLDDDLGNLLITSLTLGLTTARSLLLGVEEPLREPWGMLVTVIACTSTDSDEMFNEEFCSSDILLKLIDDSNLNRQQHFSAMSVARMQPDRTDSVHYHNRMKVWTETVQKQSNHNSTEELEPLDE